MLVQPVIVVFLLIKIIEDVGIIKIEYAYKNQQHIHIIISEIKQGRNNIRYEKNKM